MDALLTTLINRDNLSKKEAMILINDMAQQVLEGEDPEEVLMSDVGLEPDYVMELLEYCL